MLPITSQRGPGWEFYLWELPGVPSCCPGQPHLLRAGTGKRTRAFSLLPGVNGVTSPRLKRQTFSLKQRAQGVAASGCCCFSHLCWSAPCRYPFSLEILQHPFASWVPLGGLAMAWRDISPWALCLELGAVGHRATAPPREKGFSVRTSSCIVSISCAKDRPSCTPGFGRDHFWSSKLPWYLFFSRLPSMQVHPCSSQVCSSRILCRLLP